MGGISRKPGAHVHFMAAARVLAGSQRVKKRERRDEMARARIWLAGYDRTWLGADTAGITLAAYLLPAAIGDASLAGLPPEAGLYSCLFGGLVFWLFCSSRLTAITVTSAISLLVGASLSEIAAGDPARHAALAACTALLVAAWGSWPTRSGPALSSTSFRKPCSSASSAESRCFWPALSCRSCSASPAVTATSGNTWATFSQPWADQHGVPDAGRGGPRAPAARQDRSKHRPVALFVVIGGIIAAGVLRLDERGVALLGAVPRGPADAGAAAHHAIGYSGDPAAGHGVFRAGGG